MNFLHHLSVNFFERIRKLVPTINLLSDDIFCETLTTLLYCPIRARQTFDDIVQRGRGDSVGKLTGQTFYGLITGVLL